MAVVHGKMESSPQPSPASPQNSLGDGGSLTKPHAAVQAWGCQLFWQGNS